jgi:superfamily I DNA/RNA helicase/RecB family exonuclease
VLDPAQERVAAHRGGPLLVLAGPGTGKTATLVETVARRVEAGAAPESLLLLTFSRRAAAELRNRLALRLGGRKLAPAAWTFHSFCLAFVTEERARIGVPAPRLLTGPEQDVVIRELLRGDLLDGTPWPAPLDGVLDTRGLTEEVRSLIARAQLLGMSSAELDAASGGRADWQAVARLYEQYQQSLEAQSLLDYTELLARAAQIANEPEPRERLRARFESVWVDEYQDTDLQQERLLHALAGDGRDLTVVGDPDQAIYAFRGAEVENILHFRERFTDRAGGSARVEALGTCRRSGAELVACSRRIAARIPVPPGFSHRDLGATDAPGSVEAVTLPAEGAEAEWIADTLRRAHLDDGLAWSQMAVLVRSSSSISLLRRAFGSMGVPVEVAADEVPLAQEPAIAPLLLALRAAEEPPFLTSERARELLISPLVGADSGDLRRLSRALREAARALDPDAVPEPSAVLLHCAMDDPALVAGLPARDAAPLRRLIALLAGARAALVRGGSPAEALWTIWDGSPWRRRLAATAGGYGRDARAADRDLDAVVALFEAVQRAQEQRVGIGVTGVLETLAAQQIPAGSDEDRGIRREGVRLLTAHRSKGLEWDLVVVAHVQEASWPDLRPRGSLLSPQELGLDGPQLAPDVRALLADERRLFYVACTRARTRLVVTAVESIADDGERPSRFLGELGIRVGRATRPDRPRTLAGLVAALRCEAVDPAASPAMRDAATFRLARLAEARDDAGHLLVPAASPDRWWGMLDRSIGTPYDPERAVALSASTVTKLDECPLAWFLAHEARGESAATVALGFGKVLHALADLVAREKLPADESVLIAELDRVWPSLGYDVPWQQANEREQARLALHRLVNQLAVHRGRALVASEVDFEHEVDTETGPVRLRGRMDRIERDEEGRAVVVDLKTGKKRLTQKDVPSDRQLALYQYVIEVGAVDQLPPGQASGGAELWQLRDGGTELPTVQRQLPTSDHQDLLTGLADARRLILDEAFVATPGNSCKRCAFRTACPAVDDGQGVIA